MNVSMSMLRRFVYSYFVMVRIRTLFISSTTSLQLFLGTVISINRTPNLSFTEPIAARLRQRDTGLRATADASLLVQSLIDLGTYSRDNAQISCSSIL